MRRKEVEMASPIDRLIEFSEQDTCDGTCQPDCKECIARGIISDMENMAAMFFYEMDEE